MDLKGKRAVVCGGSKGIGKASALELAKAGAEVIVMSRNEDSLSEILASLRKISSLNHQTIQADSSHPEEAAEKIKTAIGINPVQILVNNSGGPASGNILEEAAEKFRIVFNQHLISYHLIAQVLVPGMKSSGYGRIINIISTSVKTPIHNLGVSNTIRWAVAGWAKTMANELSKFNITVNNVLPGATKTERLEEIIQHKSKLLNVTPAEVEHGLIEEIPMLRFGLPEEVAAAVAFLASPAASYISGINLPVDGGRTAAL